MMLNDYLLDQGSLRSSPRDGLSTPYRLTKRSSVGLFHHVLVYMGNLHLVIHALNLSILDAGTLIVMRHEKLMMFSLNMVDYPMSFILLSTCFFFAGQVEGTILRHF